MAYYPLEIDPATPPTVEHFIRRMLASRCRTRRIEIDLLELNVKQEWCAG